MKFGMPMGKSLQLSLFLVGVLPLLAEDIRLTRRVAILTQAFVDSAVAKSVPAAITGDKSKVVVFFRLSEQGAVLDARASGGSEGARKSALAAIQTWRFKPTTINQRPVQMHSGVAFDFSVSPPAASAAPGKSFQEISPVLSTRCSLAIVNNAPDMLRACQEELEKLLSNKARTPMEAFSAHADLAIALLKTGGQDAAALRELDAALQLAPNGLSDSDGELAHLHWHRALAQERLGNLRAASSELQEASKILSKAEESSGLNAYKQDLAEVQMKQKLLLEKQ